LPSSAILGEKGERKKFCLGEVFYGGKGGGEQLFLYCWGEGGGETSVSVGRKEKERVEKEEGAALLFFSLPIREGKKGGGKVVRLF